MKRLVCHGDSLTEGADVGSRHAWPDLLANQLYLEVINSGIGGDTSGGLLGRFYPEVVQRSPFGVVILAGTNDLWWGLGPESILANIFAMACQAQYHGIAAVIATPLPFDTELLKASDMSPPARGYADTHAILRRLVASLAAAASQSELPLLAFYDLFVDANGETKTQYFLEDGLHPNKAGHLLMARHAAERFRDWFNFGGEPTG